MSVPSALLLGLFAIWWLATAVAQIRIPAVQRIRRFDRLGLLPGWNFFAPRPIVQDFEVRFRPWWTATGFGPWQRLNLPEPRRLRDAVFNPTRREKKAMFEACVRILRSYQVHHPNDRAVVLSMSYILVLGRVATEVDPAHGVQFSVWVLPAPLPGRPEGAARQVFRSDLHALGRSDPVPMVGNR